MVADVASWLLPGQVAQRRPGAAGVEHGASCKIRICTWPATGFPPGARASRPHRLPAYRMRATATASDRAPDRPLRRGLPQGGMENRLPFRWIEGRTDWPGCARPWAGGTPALPGGGTTLPGDKSRLPAIFAKGSMGTGFPSGPPATRIGGRAEPHVAHPLLGRQHLKIAAHGIEPPPAELQLQLHGPVL